MLERVGAPLRGFGDWLARVVAAVYRPFGRPGKWFQDFLNGSWLGHPTHPVIVDVVLGGAAVVVVFDVASLLGASGFDQAAGVAVAVIVLSGLAAIGTGLTDFKDTASGDERNVAVLHGLTNAIATLAYLASFVLRVGDVADIGRWFSLAGAAILVAGGYIGGHLVFKYGYMVNANAFARGSRAREYAPVIATAEVPDDTPTRATVGSTTLVVVRRGDLVYALKATCSHAGGPLDKGTLDGDSIVCPWHGSTFRLSDGSVRHGPATTRQVTYDARISDGQVEVSGPRA